MAVTLSSLEERYCPQIDSALLQAIVADYDLSDTSAIEALHSLLSSLEAAAIAESVEQDPPPDSTSQPRSIAAADLIDYTLSSSTSDLVPQKPVRGDQQSASPPEDVDTDDKLAILHELFPDFSSYDITYTLNKCHGSWQRALDDLLNQQYLSKDDTSADGEIMRLKGADGFSEEYSCHNLRKKKVSGRGKATASALHRRRSNSAPEADSSVGNAWKGGRHETKDGLSTLIPQYSALSLESDVALDQDDATLATTAHGDHNRYRNLASGHSASYQVALEQARAAYRRSRSNRLMGGAAAYYSQLGRAHAQSSRGYTSAAADALVASSSMSDSIDLHGVNVQDAVRISKTQVRSWWNSLGEDKINGRLGAATRAKGFTIVTGIGRHSEGGKGKLGPAVKQALTAEGWRIELGTGTILVKGKAR